MHEIFARFDRPIDPATFAANATRTRVLAADDSQVSQRLYEHLLTSMNVELTCVSNGIEAVEKALQQTYDLVLMDVEMPEMDGLTAIRLLRNKGYVRPIVAVSAMTDEADRQAALDAGCDDFLGKPLTRAGLEGLVQSNKPAPLVSALLDDPGMTELIDSFVAALPRAIIDLESAFGSENFDELERQARALKGDAAGIGFQAITEAADSVESSVRAGGDPNQTRQGLADLVRLCLAARPATAAPAGVPAVSPMSLDDLDDDF